MRTTKRGLARLDQLATFLYRVPSARFNMEVWFSDSGGSLIVGTLPESLEDIKCNSAACATGWASVLFKNEGLLLEPFDSTWSAAYCPKFRRKNGELLTNWSAVTAFFRICQRDAENLFGADENKGAGPRQIAKKIRSFLKSKNYEKLTR